MNSSGSADEYSSTPETTYSKDHNSSPIFTEKERMVYSPNNFKYYNDHLNKTQFNMILINSSINLLKLLYPDLDEKKLNLRFFMIELLRRSKTTIQSLQIACYYLVKIYRENDTRPAMCPKKLFLGMIIIASKFNQDANYSFRTWLKICGCGGNSAGQDFDVQTLRKIERDCLQLLEYRCYINNMTYENWCNMLLIFGYDFIKLHKVFDSEIVWDSDGKSVQSKLFKWSKFLSKFNIGVLDSTKIRFSDYYISQVGHKVLFYTENLSVSSLFGSKRVFDEDVDSSLKKSRVY